MSETLCFIGELMIRAKKYGLTYAEYVEQANIINKFVLPSGLEETELNTAIRQEEWDKIDVSSNSKFLFEMTQDIIENWNCLLVNNNLAYFNQEKNRYDNNIDIIYYYLLEKYKYENITLSKVKEVIEQVNIQLRAKPKYWYNRNEEYILCENQLVSMNKDEVIPNTRTIFTDIYYPFEIMTKEEFENFNGRAKQFMEEISCYDSIKNPDVLTIIFECIGCMLAPSKPFGKIFIWYGSGANGKSLLIKLIQEIMGDLLTNANILSINDKFALENVINGVCNVTDDVGITAIKETGILKSLIQGGDIEICRKYKTPIKWKPNSQFVMCCNEIPNIEDTSPGMIRRLAFIPFELELPEEKQDIKLETKLKEDVDNLRYILTGGIFAYREAIKRGHLTEIKKQKELEDDFLAENQSPIDLFYNYLIQEEGQGDIERFYRWLDGKTTEEIYKRYKEYRVDEKIESQKAFTRRFNKKLKTRIELFRKTIGGASFTSYRLK